MLETQMIGPKLNGIINQGQKNQQTSSINDVLKVTKGVFEEYHEGFIYIDPKDVKFYNNEIGGNFKFTGSAYLKEYSKILNNTEAMFIFNQLQYVLISSIFLQEGRITAANIKDAHAALDGIVYKNMQFDFKRSITKEDELNFHCQANKFTDHKNRTCFEIELNLVDEAFKINGTAVCLSKSIHIDGV